MKVILASSLLVLIIIQVLFHATWNSEQKAMETLNETHNSVFFYLIDCIRLQFITKFCCGTICVPKNFKWKSCTAKSSTAHLNLKVELFQFRTLFFTIHAVILGLLSNPIHLIFNSYTQLMNIMSCQAKYMYTKSPYTLYGILRDWLNQHNIYIS